MKTDRLIRAARGRRPADVVFKNGRVINVFSGEVERIDLAVADGVIVGLGDYHGVQELDLDGRFLAPGLIDPHLHLESTMLHPAELVRLLAPAGTTAVVADPHEIANVLGLAGIKFLMDLTANLPVDFYFMAPSCVPATHLETAGACLSAEDLKELTTEPRVLGLGEVMNFPGVIEQTPEVWDKLNLFAGRPIDGHAPLVGGPDLAAYILSGVGTEHESSQLEEAREKLARGLRIFIRQGSTARNLSDLLPLINDHNWRRISFCTDDRHPEDLLNHGHLDHILRLAAAGGLDPVRAVSMCTLNAAETFGLAGRGALAPGYAADLVVFDSLEDFRVELVYKNGLPAAENGRLIDPPARPDLPAWVSPMNLAPLSPDTFRPAAAGSRARVIEVKEGQLITGSLVVDAPMRDGRLAADAKRGLALAAVVERYGRTGNVGLGLVKGFGLSRGALASSVAHDSHNIVAVGQSAEELIAAILAVSDMGGGLAAVDGDRVLSRLPLPLAGLMSLDTAENVAAGVRDAEGAAHQLGCGLESPFMALSFLALPVVPRLKLTDQGLVDVDRFEVVPLFTD